MVGIEIPGLKVSPITRSLNVQDLQEAERLFQSEEEHACGRIVRNNLTMIEERLAALPNVTTHGDLKWGNMAVPQPDLAAAPYIFDWETVALNCIGECLHHFVEDYFWPERRDFRQRLFEGFCHGANRKLSLQGDLEKDDLVLAALSFAIKKRMIRVRRADPDKPAPRARARRLMVQLAGHLKARAEFGERR